jgi:O-antigen/teichoic acid export membrane protein
MLKNVKSTLKNSVIYGLGNFSSKLVGFILLPVITKHLTVAEYGVYGLIDLAYQTVITIFGFSLYQAFFRWYWQKDLVDKQKSMYYSFTVSLVFIIIGTFIIVSPFIFFGTLSKALFHEPGYKNILYLMLISAGLEIFIQSPNTLIRLQEKSQLFLKSSLVRLLFSFVLTLLFIVVFRMKVEGIYWAQIAGQIVYILFLSRFILKNIEPIFEWKLIKDMFVFAFPLSLSALSVIGLNMADRYVLSILGNISDVGIYSLGLKMANIIQAFIVTSVNLAISPMIYKMMDAPDNKRFYSKIMTYYIFGLMFFIIGMSVYSMEVIKIVSTKPYWDSYKIVPLISFSIGFMALRDIAFTGLYIKKKTVTLANIVLVVSILNIGLNFLFIHYFKNFGGAIASLISQCTYFSIVYYLSQKAYNIPYELRKIITVLLLGCFLVLVAFAGNNLSVWLRLFIKTVVILAFPVILYFLKFYDEAELNAIAGFWIKWKNPAKWKENISNMKISF